MMNERDKLDGMVKIKGKCGYEFIGGCKEFRKCKIKTKELTKKLEKIKELCQIPNEPYYNSECEFGKGRIDLGQEILEIIENEK